MLTIHLPDGSRREYAREVSAYEVASEIGPGLAKAAVVAEVEGELRDLHAPLGVVGADGSYATQSLTLRLLTRRDAEALEVLRHSCAHVMAQAVMRLFGGSEDGEKGTGGERPEGSSGVALAFGATS